VLKSHKAHRTALISVSLALSQTPAYTARPRASASRGVLVCAPAFAGTRCTYASWVHWWCTELRCTGVHRCQLLRSTC